MQEESRAKNDAAGPGTVVIGWAGAPANGSQVAASCGRQRLRSRKRRSQMQTRRTPFVVVAALAFPVALAMAGGMDGQDTEKNNVPDNVLVEFGATHPQPIPVQLSHVLVPDEVTIRKGGTVTFRVNGGGHGIAIYPVSKKTTREDITEDLCVHDPATHLCVDPTFANGAHSITDGKGKQVIASGPNAA